MTRFLKSKPGTNFQYDCQYMIKISSVIIYEMKKQG